MVDSRRTHFTYPTIHGPITICATPRGVVSVSFDDVPASDRSVATEITNRAATEIQEYLAGKRSSFDVPLDVHGSSFQRAVWECVCELPYGTSCTAADVAEALGKPGAHRSVGTAIRRNPAPILIPTHRVNLPNATGKVARIFRALRALEQTCVSGDRAD